MVRSILAGDVHTIHTCIHIQFTLSSLQTAVRKRGDNCDAACDVTCPTARVDSVHHTELVARPIGDRQTVKSSHGVGEMNARYVLTALQRSPARKRFTHASRNPSEHGIAEVNARENECRCESLSGRRIENSLELAQMTEVKKSKSIRIYPRAGAFKKIPVLKAHDAKHGRRRCCGRAIRNRSSR